MNDMSAVAHDRLIAQIAEALFGQPGMSLMEMANRRAEIEEMRRAAERYFWLRGNDSQIPQECLWMANESFDSAIDAAMKEQAE